MCIIAFSLNEHPTYKLILAGNRDEFYDRPTNYAQWWEDKPLIFGGKDLQAGGTWLGINRNGKIAAVTNYRDPKNIRDDAISRGDLAKDFLTSDISAKQYLEELSERSSNYNGFNLLLFEKDAIFHFSNYENRINKINRGNHALSNALLDTPWPKVAKLKDQFSKNINGTFSTESLLQILEDDTLALDNELPETGIPYEWEKAISAICIKTEKYGTCCSTIITIDHDNHVQFIERSFPVGSRNNKIIREDFNLVT